MKWTQEEHNYLVQLKEKGLMWHQIAEEMTMKFGRRFNKEQCRSRWRQNRHLVSDNPQLPEEEKILEDGSYVSNKVLPLTPEQKRSKEALLIAHGYNPKEFQFVTGENKIYNTNDKINGIQTLYSSSIKVKERVYELTYEEIKEDIQDLMKNYKPRIFKPIRYANNGQALEVNISDLHLNKLGYVNGEYDHNEAERRFFFVIEDVINETQGRSFEKILFVWSHDFFNIDNLNKTTTAGTPQDVSQRFSDMYKQGKRMLIQGIDLLKQIAPVETVQVGANHDRLTSYTMSEVLEAWYKDDDNVIIDTDPLHRKYRRWGKCLIGFSHGDKEKKRLGKIMPIEARKDWGETLFCEIHAAHIHTEQAVKEENGVIVRYLSPLSGTDTWHYESGYVGSLVKAQSFIWDKELGVRHIIQSPITV
jgi:hypothetical protein